MKLLPLAWFRRLRAIAARFGTLLFHGQQFRTHAPSFRLSPAMLGNACLNSYGPPAS